MSRLKRRARSTLSTSPYRSKLESRVAELLPVVRYEEIKLPYTVPASKHKYVTDFCIGENSYIEVKGRLTAADRKKYILVRDQHPEITLRFFFDKSDNKLYKGSPTTYAAWAEKESFEWTDTKRGLPKEWLVTP